MSGWATVALVLFVLVVVRVLAHLARIVREFL